MIKKTFSLLINLKFAIFLLICIAFIIGIGSIIEQDQIFEYYKQNYPITKPVLGFITYKWIFAFELNHIYKSWIFLILIFFLGLSLFLCTFKQQLPLLKFARHCIFLQNSEKFSRMDLKIFFTINNKYRFAEKSILFFQSSHFFVHQQKNVIYAVKGILGKLGPILVHFSLICILLGAINGAIGKFNAQEFIPKGEIIHIQNLLGSSWFSYFPKFSIRLNDFWIEYNQQKISQFYSDLSILNNFGQEIFQKTISVNQPLNYNQVTIYQIDWEFLGIRIQKEGNLILQYPLNLISNVPKIWATWIFSEDGSEGRILFLDQLKQSAKIYDNLGNFLMNLNFGESFVLKNKNYFLLDSLPETGLQIKYDPSIPLTFTGFGALMVSTLLSYQTYSQMWICLKKDGIFLGGQTTRSKSFFEIEFKRFVKNIENIQKKNYQGKTKL